ncbi:MAG: hypothetical protein ACYCVM_10045, partial [Acidiferrobacter sp.]
MATVVEGEATLVGGSEGTEGHKGRRALGLAGAFLVLFILRFGPLLHGLTRPGQAVLGVFLWFIVCMV